MWSAPAERSGDGAFDCFGGSRSRIEWFGLIFVDYLSPLQGEDVGVPDPGVARETRLPLATISHAFSVKTHAFGVKTHYAFSVKTTPFSPKSYASA